MVKLKEYIENLNKFAKENPECLDMEVITAIDDEGNGYNYVNYSPSKGVFDDGDFVGEEDYECCGYGNEDTNAVCVN